MVGAALGQVEGTRADTNAVAFEQLAQPGRLVELSGQGAAARHTTAAALVRQAQLEGETTAWIQPAGGPLYPPDIAASGVDLGALVVLQIPSEHGQLGLVRAGEMLLKSGAFGLCVLDLSATALQPVASHGAWHARLAAGARLHHARVVLLTCAPHTRPSQGPMVSLRVEPQRHRQSPGLFTILPTVLKHKGTPLHLPSCLRRGPAGLG